MKNINSKNWLEYAIDFDVYHTSVAPEVIEIRDMLYTELVPKVNPCRSIKRYKDALRSVLLNLYVGWMLGRPIKYSRNEADYRHPKRYGKLFLKPRRLFSVIDALAELGYIQAKGGFNDRGQKIGRQSRMWATEKLINLFMAFKVDRPGIIQRSIPEELIQKKNIKKRQVDYPETTATSSMREKLSNYNDFISGQNITVALKSDSQVSLHFLNQLHSNELSGAVSISNIVVSSSYNHPNLDNPYSLTSATPHSVTITMTNCLRNLCCAAESYSDFSYHNYPEWYSVHTDYGLPTIVDRSKIFTSKPNVDRHDFYTTKRELSEYCLDSISYTVEYSYLHRVFSRNKFNLGGRFWGAYHLEMPKGLRQNIMINGEPTAELDYKAMHIRMLYHLEDRDYRCDPYIALSSNDDERVAYKLSTLVIINASNEVKAQYGIKRVFDENGIKMDTSATAVQRIINNFKSVHEPISHYLCSGIGNRLMNYDSMVAEGVLNQLTDEGIPCLPIHDSFIVPIQHEDMLWQAMMDEYQKVMEFSPIIDKKH